MSALEAYSLFHRVSEGIFPRFTVCNLFDACVVHLYKHPGRLQPAANLQEHHELQPTATPWCPSLSHAASGGVSARPGVVRLMDEARAAGVPVAVCSAATKAAVQVGRGPEAGCMQVQGVCV